jgi:hypothetical protein
MATTQLSLDTILLENDTIIRILDPQTILIIRVYGNQYGVLTLSQDTKTFLWRILNDAVPVRQALHSKGILIDNFCPRCATKLETLNHAFMNCPFAQRVWFGSNINIKVPDSPEFDFKDWLRSLIQITKAETIICAASVIYNLWYARNKLIFDNYASSIEDTMSHIRKTIQEYKTCNNINNQSSMMQAIFKHKHHNQSANSTRWRKPENNWYKVNIDANLTELNTWGLSAICRNDDGEVLAAATWKMTGMTDPAEAEAYGLYLAT